MSMSITGGCSGISVGLDVKLVNALVPSGVLALRVAAKVVLPGKESSQPAALIHEESIQAPPFPLPVADSRTKHRGSG